jgi:tRNA threonylcarbamoyladenosine biosynthesis protein TsaB
VALSLDDAATQLRHESVSTGASQLLLPWIDELLLQSNLQLSDLDAIAIGIGPGAFTGVRLGVAAVQGLAIAADLPVVPVASLDAIAAQLVNTENFLLQKPEHFVIAVDARMEEIYWANYRYEGEQVLPRRLGPIHLSRPEDIDLKGAQYLAGSAINTYGDRLFTQERLPSNLLDAQIHISALGILDCAKQMMIDGKQCSVQELEPLYVRNKVALTTNERELAFKKGSQS